MVTRSGDNRRYSRRCDADVGCARLVEGVLLRGGGAREVEVRLLDVGCSLVGRHQMSRLCRRLVAVSSRYSPVAIVGAAVIMALSGPVSCVVGRWCEER